MEILRIFVSPTLDNKYHLRVMARNSKNEVIIGNSGFVDQGEINKAIGELLSLMETTQFHVRADQTSHKKSSI